MTQQHPKTSPRLSFETHAVARSFTLAFTLFVVFSAKAQENNIPPTTPPTTPPATPPATPPEPSPTNANERPETAWDNPPPDYFVEPDPNAELEPQRPLPLPYRLGFGFGIQPLALNNAAILVPIDLGHLRTELGFLFSYDRRVGQNTTRIESESTLELLFNAGFFYLRPTTEFTSIYAGGRFGVSWSRTSVDIQDTSTNGGSKFVEAASGFGMHISPVLGGEYLLFPSFAIALELQLDFAYYPEQTVTPEQPSSLAQSSLDFGTNAGLMFRWFF